MKRSYSKPATRILEIEISNIICGSMSKKEYIPICGKGCQLWHICRDRSVCKPCKDYKL